MRSLRALTCLIALAAGWTARAAAPVSVEDEVRAAFVLNFAQFATWPDGVAERTVFAVGVLGPETAARALERTMQDRQVGGRAVAVVRLTSPEEAVRCDVVYVQGDLQTRSREALRAVRGRPVLTIGTAEDFLDKGGHVRLKVVDGRMRFEVDAGAAEAAGIRLSSRLLRLADRLEPR